MECIFGTWEDQVAFFMGGHPLRAIGSNAIDGVAVMLRQLSHCAVANTRTFQNIGQGPLGSVDAKLHFQVGSFISSSTSRPQTVACNRSHMRLRCHVFIRQRKTGALVTSRNSTTWMRWGSIPFMVPMTCKHLKKIGHILSFSLPTGVQNIIFYIL